MRPEPKKIVEFNDGVRVTDNDPPLVLRITQADHACVCGVCGLNLDGEPPVRVRVRPAESP